MCFFFVHQIFVGRRSKNLKGRSQTVAILSLRTENHNIQAVFTLKENKLCLPNTKLQDQQEQSTILITHRMYMGYVDKVGTTVTRNNTNWHISKWWLDSGITELIVKHEYSTAWHFTLLLSHSKNSSYPFYKIQKCQISWYNCNQNQEILLTHHITSYPITYNIRDFISYKNQHLAYHLHIKFLESFKYLFPRIFINTLFSLINIKVHEYSRL